jgi:hypothetical protein
MASLLRGAVQPSRLRHGDIARTHGCFRASPCESSILLPPSIQKCVSQRPLVVTGFQIDRRRSLELAWERQHKEDELLARVENDIAEPRVVEISNLTHLEAALDAMHGRLAVLALYSRSCGVCKEIRQDLDSICRGSHRQRAGIVYLQHDVYDEFDSPSDICRYYRVKSVPRFLFFVDGAVIRSVGMPDLRQWRAVGGRKQIRSVLDGENERLKAILWELLVKNAPSARR